MKTASNTIILKLEFSLRFSILVNLQLIDVKREERAKPREIQQRTDDNNFCLFKFGGMSKRNTKQSKKNNSLHKYFIITTSSEENKNSQEIPSKTQPNRKRLCPDLHARDRAPSQQLSPKKPAFFTQAKAVPIEEFLINCPKLDQLVKFLQSSVSLQKHLVKNILKKYLSCSSNSLWSYKYVPKESSELFNTRAGVKIKDWLNAFFEYKNKICEESDSFLNDFSEDKSQCDIYKNIRINKWQLSALVVQGRPGIGKSSAIRAVAQEMQLDLQECGNDYNQTKYLKEKNESTQSESVKTAISKKNKLEKNSQMITKFLPPIQREKANQSKKSQLIHNIGEIYPQNQAARFYGQLLRCVQFSKIPFILTNSGEKLPKECARYDVIEFQIGLNQKVQELLWIIYHIEQLLKINTLKQIDKQFLFEEVNKQISGVEIEKIVDRSKIEQLCFLHNYRLDYIFTYLQFYQNLQQINLNNLFIQKYHQFTNRTFLDEIHLIKVPQAEEKCYSSSKKQMLSQKQDGIITQQSEQIEKIKQTQLSDYLRILKISRIEDTFKEQAGQSKPLAPGWQQDLQGCIDNKIHKQVKSGLINKINLQINSLSERFKSTLRRQQLQYLPMLMKQKRTSRNSKASDDLYNKYFEENQCEYIKKYAHLIKNQ